MQDPQRPHTGEFGVDRVKCGFRKKKPATPPGTASSVSPQVGRLPHWEKLLRTQEVFARPTTPPCWHLEMAGGEKEPPGPDGDLRIPRVLIKSTHVISIFFMYSFIIYLVEG